MFKISIKFSLIILVIGFTCCDEIFEKDISSISVKVLSPGQNWSLNDPSVLFWWDTISGVNQYKLQIVKPNYIEPQEVMIDTLMTYNKITVSLDTGNYQFKITGSNYSYTTLDTIYNLNITE